METSKYKDRVITVHSLSESVWQHFKHPLPQAMLSKNCSTLGQAIQIPDSELKQMRNFGDETLQFIHRVRNYVVELETAIEFLGKYSK